MITLTRGDELPLSLPVRRVKGAPKFRYVYWAEDVALPVAAQIDGRWVPAARYRDWMVVIQPSQYSEVGWALSEAVEELERISEPWFPNILSRIWAAILAVLSPA